MQLSLLDTVSCYFLLNIKANPITNPANTKLAAIVPTIKCTITYIELEIKQYIKIPHNTIKPTLAMFAAF